MMETFKFGRLDKKLKPNNVRYDTHYNNDANWTPRDLEMRDLGGHISVTIRNYMREDLLLVDNVRKEPKRYSSIYANDRFLLEDTTNLVIIEIRTREVELDKDGNNKIKRQSKTEVRCPGHLLQTHSLFVEELGCYLTIQSRLNATRELIAHDTRFPEAHEVSVPESMVKPDPVSTLRMYEPLIKNSLERMDKLRVRVGVPVDKDPIRVPDHIKNLRIAVMDKTFSPYTHNRMVYDPSLLEDEFVVENLHFVTSEPLISTYDRLQKAEGRAFFIDTQEHRTLGGNLCGLAIFADPEALNEYLFAHKADEVYEELMEGFADKSGNPVLKRRIDALENDIKAKDTLLEEIETTLKFEQEQVKTLKRRVTAHEDTIKKIKENYDSNNSYEMLIAQLENERSRHKLEQERLEFERDELIAKLKMSEQNRKTTFYKSIADTAKSTWGILVIVSTAVVAIYKGYNKLKSS